MSPVVAPAHLQRSPSPAAVVENAAGFVQLYSPTNHHDPVRKKHFLDVKRHNLILVKMLGTLRIIDLSQAAFFVKMLGTLRIDQEAETSWNSHELSKGVSTLRLIQRCTSTNHGQSAAPQCHAAPRHVDVGQVVIDVHGPSDRIHRHRRGHGAGDPVTWSAGELVIWWSTDG